eukprot:1956028-Amphidinium_carterae.2
MADKLILKVPWGWHNAPLSKSETVTADLDRSASSTAERAEQPSLVSHCFGSTLVNADLGIKPPRRFEAPTIKQYSSGSLDLAMNVVSRRDLRNNAIDELRNL